MSGTIESTQPSVRFFGPKLVVPLLSVWFVLAIVLSASGALQDIPSAVPLVLGFVVPASGYFALYFASAGFRRFVFDQNLRLVTLALASRTCGAIFFVKYAEGVLPGRFAIPTGISDVAVGLTAVVAAFRLVSNAGAAKRGFVTWHLFGILGLIVSGSLGILTSPMPAGLLATTPTSQAMNSLPLSLVPTFLGPVVLILHLMALSIAFQQAK